MASLTTPTVSLSNNIMTVTVDDNTDTVKIFKDNVLVKTTYIYSISPSVSSTVYPNPMNATKICSEQTKVLSYTILDTTKYVMPDTIWVGSTSVTDGVETTVPNVGTFLYSKTSSQTGSVTISNPLGNISFTMTALQKYSVSTSLTKTSATTTIPTSVLQGSTTTITFVADSGYELPSSISVSGVTTYQWVKSTGTLTLISPINDVSITITSTSLYHTITLDTTNAVLNYTYYNSSGSSVTLDTGRNDLVTVDNCSSVNSVSYYYESNCYTRLCDSSGTIITSSLSLPYTPTVDNYKIYSYSEHIASCIDYYTQVTMADGTLKNLGDIEVGDYVLSIDFDTMKLVSRKVIYSGRDDPDYDNWVTNYYVRNEYSDGKVIKQSMRHRMYNLENEAYVHLDDVWETGQHCYTLEGTNPTLVRRVMVKEPQHYARITLEGCNNYFANGLSTGDSECPTGIVLDHQLERA